MIRSLWIAKTGLDAQQTQMDVISNNLANVSTNGFKRSRAVFEDLLYQTLRQPGAQSSQQTQFPPACSWAPVCGRWPPNVFTQGNLQQTGNPLDVADQRQGLLPDSDAGRQHCLYPRRLVPGDSQGQLVTSSGYPVQPATHHSRPMP